MPWPPRQPWERSPTPCGRSSASTGRSGDSQRFWLAEITPECEVCAPKRGGGGREHMTGQDDRRPRFLVVGGGPAGNSAATTAASLGAKVTLVESSIVGGAAHLWDCITSKTMVA